MFLPTPPAYAAACSMLHSEPSLKCQPCCARPCPTRRPLPAHCPPPQDAAELAAGQKRDVLQGTAAGLEPAAAAEVAPPSRLEPSAATEEVRLGVSALGCGPAAAAQGHTTAAHVQTSRRAAGSALTHHTACTQPAQALLPPVEPEAAPPPPRPAAEAEAEAEAAPAAAAELAAGEAAEVEAKPAAAAAEAAEQPKAAEEVDTSRIAVAEPEGAAAAAPVPAPTAASAPPPPAARPAAEEIKPGPAVPPAAAPGTPDAKASTGPGLCLVADCGCMPTNRLPHCPTVGRRRALQSARSASIGCSATTRCIRSRRRGVPGQEAAGMRCVVAAVQRGRDT